MAASFLAWIPIVRIRLMIRGRPGVPGPLAATFRRTLYTIRTRQPNCNRKRLLPSQGIGMSVLSKPAAVSSGLWARFWK